MTAFPKLAPRFTCAIKVLFAILGLALFVAPATGASADTNTDHNITYVAPWGSGGTYDWQTHTQGCLTDSLGSAESCVVAWAAAHDRATSIEGGSWTPLQLPTCVFLGIHPTECVYAQFIGGLYPNFTIGQFCSYGGNYVAPVNLRYPGYCLMQGVPNKNTGCPNCKGQQTNDPVDSASGNQYATVTDYRGGGAFPLVFSRAYNSNLAGQSDENLGNGWGSDIGAHLSIASRGQLFFCPEPVGSTLHYLCPVIGYDPTSSPIEVTVRGADGSQSTYTYPYNTAPDGTQLTTEQTSTGQLFFVGHLPAPSTGSGFRFVRTDGYVEYFTSTGVLATVQNPSGLQQTYQYNAGGQLVSVTDPIGRQMTFTYDDGGRVQTVTTPTGALTYAYDANGNLASVQYPDNSTLQYKYEDTSFPHAMTGIVDEDGNRYATWGYDSTGRGISSQNAGGVDSYSVSYATNSAGVVTSATMTEPNGHTRTLGFTNINFLNLLTSVSAPCIECGDKTKSLTYDSNGFVASKTDFDGNVTQYTHDAFGNEISRTEAYGTQDARTITTQWDLSLNQPTLITEPGRATGYTYDGVGHVLTKTVTDTATQIARTTTYTYYSSGVANGLPDTVTDPLGHVTSYTYDSQGNLASVTNALNQVTQITQYDASGMPLTIVDPNGVVTTLTYDARQRLLTRTVAGAETQFAYDPAGNLTKVTLPTGSFLTYTYDAAHRLTGISDAVGDSISYTLDNLGNRTAENTYDPSQTLTKTLQRTYNNLNQLLTTVGGASQTTTYTDDTMGNVSSIKDPMTQVTGQTFDALNRLETVVDPESGNTTYNYDPLDRVQDVTDPRGLDTHYSYDAFGDVLSQQSPDTGTTQYTYDLDGNRLNKTDARGITATYSYDALNRLMTITYPDASRDVTYTYDQGTYGIGHLTGIQDGTGTTAYTYDDHGNTIQKVVTLGGHAFTVGYQYDTADNLTGMTYPSGLQVTYGRDTAERITSVAVNSAAIVSGISYEPFGPLTGFTYGNGLTETRTYDQDYRLTGIKVPGVLDWTLGDNADDDITAITDNLDGSNSQTLGYDDLNRLTSASGAYGSQGYAYDLDGNRTQETGSTPLTLGYDTASNKLLTVGGQSDSYDAMGNLLSDGAHTYSYDAAGRLTGYDSTPTAYLYNGLGQRSVKQVGPPLTISITAPANGATVSGSVSLTAAATGPDIAGVQFQLDGVNLGAPITSAPYKTTWNTAGLTPGTHSLMAIATNTEGKSVTSSAISVTVVDIPATANNGSLSTQVQQAASGILSATPAYGTQTLTFAIAAGPSHGSVAFTNASTGAFTYTPAAGYVGADSFTFTATDGFGTVSNTATESITVTDIAATANNGSVTTTAGTAASGTLSATPAYAAQTLSYALAASPAHGSVTVTNAATGAFSYTPATGYVGSDSFTFQATDAYGTVSNTATESVTVIDVAPTTGNGSVSTTPDVTVSGTLSATLAYLGQTLTYSLSTNPAHGTVTLTNAGTGAFSYTPTTGYAGSDSFTFQVTDAYGTTSNVATESITINDVAPTADNGSLTALKNTTNSGGLTATPAYTGQTLTFSITSQPAHGTLTLTDPGTGAFSYTSTKGYQGPDSFTFQVTDQWGTVSGVATESIDVVNRGHYPK